MLGSYIVFDYSFVVLYFGCYRSRVQQIIGATNNLHRRSGSVLPPPVDDSRHMSSAIKLVSRSPLDVKFPCTSLLWQTCLLLGSELTSFINLNCFY